MEVRHVVFGAVFLAVFTIGSLNIISDGRVGHALSAQFPGHGATFAEPKISIEENVTLKPGSNTSVTARIRNAKVISYENPTLFNREEARIDVDADLNPSPRMIQQSLPPSWVYDHVEPEIQMRMTLKASENLEPGNYSFRITAEPDTDVNATEISGEFSVRVVKGSAE